MLCKGFGFDDESAVSVRQHMNSLNLHPQTGEPLDQAWLSQYPASRTMPEMLEQPVLIYPDDEYDMVVEQVKEEHLPSYPTLEKFRSDLRTVFKVLIAFEIYYLLYIYAFSSCRKEKGEAVESIHMR